MVKDSGSVRKCLLGISCRECVKDVINSLDYLKLFSLQYVQLCVLRVGVRSPQTY